MEVKCPAHECNTMTLLSLNLDIFDLETSTQASPNYSIVRPSQIKMLLSSKLLQEDLELYHLR